MTTCEFSSDWAPDEILRAESGCIWSDVGANVDAILYVMRSADFAAGETICELAYIRSDAGSLATDEFVSEASGVLTDKLTDFGIASASDVINVDDDADVVICWLTEFTFDAGCAADVTPTDDVACVLTGESTTK